MNKRQDSLRLILRKIYRTNRVLWWSILGGMVMLIVVAYFLDSSSALVLPQKNAQGEQSLFLLTLFLLLLVMYFRRHYLALEKLAARAQQKTVSLTPEMTRVIENFGVSLIPFARALIFLRRYYMLIWSAANIILILGFINFIFSGHFRTFTVYATISLVTMATNYPAYGYLLKLYARLADEPLE